MHCETIRLRIAKQLVEIRRLSQVQIFLQRYKDSTDTDLLHLLRMVSLICYQRIFFRGLNLYFTIARLYLFFQTLFEKIGLRPVMMKRHIF